MVSTMAVFSVFVKHILGGVNYAFVNTWYDSRAWWLRDEDPSLPLKQLPPFKKSFFVGFIGFFSGWIVMLPLLISDIYRSRTSPKHADAVAQYTWRNAALLILPSVFDWLAVSVSLLGTKSIPAVLVVVTKATRIIFSSLLSRLFLKTRLKPYQLLSIAIIVPGVFLVGLAKILYDKSKPKKDEKSIPAGRIVLGMSLVLFSEFLRASKGVYEERLLKGKSLCAKFIATVEGAMCCVLSFLTLIVVHLAIRGPELDHVTPLPADPDAPVSQAGSYENVWHTLEFIKLSGRVQYWTAHMFITQGIISYFGLLVTKHLSAVHCALWAEIRILVVWLTEVVIYLLTDGADGQKPHQFTYVNLIGFAFIILAGLVFNRTIKVPGFPKWYDSQEASTNADASKKPSATKSAFTGEEEDERNSKNESTSQPCTLPASPVLPNVVSSI